MEEQSCEPMDSGRLGEGANDEERRVGWVLTDETAPACPGVP